MDRGSGWIRVRCWRRMGGSRGRWSTCSARCSRGVGWGRFLRRRSLRREGRRLRRAKGKSESQRAQRKRENTEIAHLEARGVVRARRSARVMVFDGAGRVLLIRCVAMRRGGGFEFWLTPGGGIEGGGEPGGGAAGGMPREG